MITSELSVLHDGKRVAIKPTDLVANAYQPRPQSESAPRNETQRRTAADAAWERDNPPLVDHDGNYHEGV